MKRRKKREVDYGKYIHSALSDALAPRDWNRVAYPHGLRDAIEAMRSSFWLLVDKQEETARLRYSTMI